MLCRNMLGSKVLERNYAKPLACGKVPLQPTLPRGGVMLWQGSSLFFLKWEGPNSENLLTGTCDCG